MVHETRPLSSFLGVPSLQCFRSWLVSSLSRGDWSTRDDRTKQSITDGTIDFKVMHSPRFREKRGKVGCGYKGIDGKASAEFRFNRIDAYIHSISFPGSSV
jgi:hypothetical protein